MKLKYQINHSSIYFGNGDNYVEVDHKNNVYKNLVDFINQKKINNFHIDFKSDYKKNLIFLKSLFYSDLVNFNIYLTKPNDLHKYILSKVFKNNVKHKGELNSNKKIIQEYNVINNKKKFKFKFSIISITQNITIERIKKLKKEFENFDLELIFVLNKKIDFNLNEKNIKILYYCQDDDKRFNISKKKNLGFQSAEGEIVIIYHDRVLITSNWLKKLSKLNISFDLYSSRITSKSSRFLDKVAYKYNEYLFSPANLYYLTYNEQNKYQYVDGGLFVINNHRYYGEKIFDESLNWLEMEDVDFIARTKLNCNLITFDKFNEVESVFKKHFKLTKNYFKNFYKLFIRRFNSPF